VGTRRTHFRRAVDVPQIQMANWKRGKWFCSGRRRVGSVGVFVLLCEFVLSMLVSPHGDGRVLVSVLMLSLLVPKRALLMLFSACGGESVFPIRACPNRRLGAEAPTPFGRGPCG
jgi:hypothetical protein